MAMIVSYSQRQQRKDMIQWSSDESMCFRIVTNEIHILDGRDLSRGIISKIHHKGLTQFKVSPASPVTIAVFNPETSGNPARCTLYQCSTPETPPTSPVSSRTMFAATEASLLWNRQGTAIIIHTQSDVDSSNASYYGATGLFIMTADGTVSAIVPQTKDGPIHDVKWSPVGDCFIISAGNMPCNSTQYNQKGEAVYEFGTAHRNTICFSPHGRFMCLAGFGNLAGEIDFYDMRKRRKIGSNSAHCTVTYGWSPDSRYFMTATLAPRMNVDNGFKLFSYRGAGPLVQFQTDHCYDALWVPRPAILYPDRGPSPVPNRPDGEGAESVPAAAVAPPPKPAAYRPPGSSGSLSVLMRKERESGVSAGKIGAQGQPPKKVPGAGGAFQQRTIPGLPPGYDPAAAKNANKPKPKADKKAVDSKPKTDEKKPVPTPAAAVQASDAAPGATALDKDKQIKATRKKLRVIQNLKQRVHEEGYVPNPDQVEKLQSEEALIKELAELEAIS